MLIRFLAKNIFSFKDEIEFNLFPGKTESLGHHKATLGGFEFLRFSAIYGANGSGKSNLIKSISLLQKMIKEGKMTLFANDFKFKLCEENSALPVSLGIEFIAGGKAYFYSLAFEADRVLSEYLAESAKEKDILIFERTFEEGVQKIDFHKDYRSTEKKRLFVEVLAEKLIQENDLLITFLSRKYSEDFKSVQTAFNWFDETLAIIKPDSASSGIAHILDKETAIKEFEKFIGKLNPQLNKEIIDDLKSEPGKVAISTNRVTGKEVALVYENGEARAKQLIAKHQNAAGKNIEFHSGQESDGTKRLIDYMPAFYGIIVRDKVFVIDEIERSIHPLVIKEIIAKLALDENLKGQLIFSTHESNLLDQSILRPDEIWFAQKDFDGSSKFYSLSDFKIHHAIDIENGYLKGRFGGIPFLGNLKDLNW